MKKKIYLGVMLIIVVISMTGCNDKTNAVDISNEKINTVKLPNEEDGYVDLKLYFNTSLDKVEMQEEQRLLNKEEILGEIIVLELIKGPSPNSELQGLFPKGTRLLSFSVVEKIAYVNLSNEAKIGMSEVSEEAVLRALSKSLCELDSIDKIQVFINNQTTDTLGGNFDISEPFSSSDIDNLKINK
ncbi:MAG: GerMN domain-containing protein [Clostridiaceae bacterium]